MISDIVTRFAFVVVGGIVLCILGLVPAAILGPNHHLTVQCCTPVAGFGAVLMIVGVMYLFMALVFVDATYKEDEDAVE